MRVESDIKGNVLLQVSRVEIGALLIPPGEVKGLVSHHLLIKVLLAKEGVRVEHYSREDLPARGLTSVGDRKGIAQARVENGVCLLTLNHHQGTLIILW